MLPFDRRDTIDSEAAADAALGLKARPLASELISLEPRMVFDGAAAATAAAVHEGASVDASASEAHEIAADMAAAAAKIAAAIQPSATKESDESKTEKPAAADTSPAPAAEAIHDLVFIDSRVADADAFANAAGPGRLVIKIEANEDGFDVISKTLAKQGAEISSIHIIGHGSEARAALGSTAFDAATVAENIDLLHGWQTRLTADADILFYGCKVAAGEKGAELIAAIASATGADVAASADDVGNSDGIVDWSLEKTTGVIEASVIAPADYAGKLVKTPSPVVRYWADDDAGAIPRAIAATTTTTYFAVTTDLSKVMATFDTSLLSTGTRQVTNDQTPKLSGLNAIAGATIKLYLLDQDTPGDVQKRVLLASSIVDSAGNFSVTPGADKALAEGKQLLGVTQTSGNDDESDPTLLWFDIDRTPFPDPGLNNNQSMQVTIGSNAAVALANNGTFVSDQASVKISGKVDAAYAGAARILAYWQKTDATVAGIGSTSTDQVYWTGISVGADGVFSGTITAPANGTYKISLLMVDAAHNAYWAGTKGYPVDADGNPDFSTGFTFNFRQAVALGADLTTFKDDSGSSPKDVQTDTTTPKVTRDRSPEFIITNASSNSTYRVTATITPQSGAPVSNVFLGTFTTDANGAATFTPTRDGGLLTEGTYDLTITGDVPPVGDLPARSAAVTTSRFEVATSAKDITFSDTVGLKQTILTFSTTDPNPTGDINSQTLSKYQLTDSLTVGSAAGTYRAPGSVITIDYYVDGSTTKKTGTATVRSDGSWLFVLPATEVGYGAHRVRVVVTDSAGQVNSDGWVAIYQTVPWSPGGIGIKDLQAWYDFSQSEAMGTAGSQVSRIIDLSGNNRSATQASAANRAEIGTNSYGAQVLNFTYDESLASSPKSDFYNILVPFSPSTLFYAGDVSTTVTYGGVQYIAGNLAQLGATGAVNSRYSFNPTGLSMGTVSLTNAGSGFVTAYYVAKSAYSVNGVSVATAADPGSLSITSIGRADQFSGSMGMILSYGAPLSAAQLNLVQQSLSQRFGTPLTLDLFQAGVLAADRASAALQYKYSQNVGGILRTSASDSVDSSQNGGLVLRNSTFLNTGASIMFGDNGGPATFGALSAALSPTNPGITGLGRTWAIDVRNGVANGKVDVQFDVASLISSSSSSQEAKTVQNLVEAFAGRTNLKLAWRASETDAWQFINDATLVIPNGATSAFDASTGRITFKDVTVGASGLRSGFITLLDGPTITSITPSRSPAVSASQPELTFTVVASSALQNLSSDSFKLTWLDGRSDPLLTVTDVREVAGSTNTYSVSVRYAGTRSGAISFDYDYTKATATDLAANAIIKTPSVTASVVGSNRLTGQQTISFSFSKDLSDPLSVTDESVAVDSGTLGPISYNATTKTYSALYTPDSGAQNNKVITLNIKQGLTTTEGGATRPISLLFAVDNVRPTLVGIDLWRSGSQTANGIAANATTNRQSLQYKVTFSEAVTNLDVADFVLTKPAGLTGTIASVVKGPGDGTVWFVNVEPVSGTGEARLSLAPTATINDVLVDPTGAEVGVAGNAMDTFATMSAAYNFDSTAPTMSFVARPNVSNAASLSFDLTFSEDMDAATMTPLAFGTVGNLANVDIAVTQSASNPRVWTVTLSGTGISQREGTVQLRYITGYLRDVAGNAVNLTTAPTPPIVTMDHIAPGAPMMTQAITNSVTPTLSGTAEKGATVTLRLGSTVLATRTASAATGAWSFAPSASLGLAEGVNEITLVATDAAGNASAPATVNLTLDTIRPTIESFSPVARYSNGNSLSYDLTFSEAVTGIGTANFTSTNLRGGTLSVEVTTDPKVWRVTVSNMTSAGDVTLKYTPTTAHKDSAANTVSGAALSATATRDLTPPDAPTLPNLYVNDARKTLTGVAEASSTVTVTSGGTSYAASLNGTTWSWTPPAEAPLSLGANTIRVTVTDQAGNATQKDFVVTLDQTAPTVTITRSSTTPTNATSVYFDVSFDEAVKAPTAANFTTAENLSNVTFTVTQNGTPANSWRVTLTGTGISTRTGPVTLALSTTPITDLAGNSVTDFPVATISVDHTIPAVAVASATYITNNARPTITGTVESGASLKVTYKSVIYNLTPTDGAWSWTPPSDLAAGATTLTFTATDDAGNIGTASTTITLDQTAPTATISRWSGGTATSAGAASTAQTFNVTDRQFKIVLSEDLGVLTASKILVTGGVINGEPIRSGATNTWFINVTPNAGTGPLSMSLLDVKDAAQNAVNVTTNEAFTRDAAAPSLISIARAAGAGVATNATNPSFIVTFSEPVLNVTAASFILTDANGAVIVTEPRPTISSVTGSGATYTVTLSNTNKALDGSTISIGLASAAGVKDAADNAASVSPSVTREVYLLDYQAPAAPSLATTMVNSTRPTLSGATEAGSTVRIVYNGINYAATVDGGQWSWTPPVALVVGANDLTVTATDAATNVSVSQTLRVTVDLTAPSMTGVTQSATAVTNANSAYFDITFSEAIDPATISSASFSTTGGLSVASVTNISGNIWRVMLADASAVNGVVSLAFASPVAIKDFAGNALSPTSNAIGSISFDHTAPALSATLGSSNVSTSAATPTKTSDPNFAVTIATEAAASVTWSVTKNGVPSTDFALTATSTGGTITKKAGVTLTRDAYAITVTSKDAADNATTTVYYVQLVSTASATDIRLENGAASITTGGSASYSSATLTFFAAYASATSAQVDIVGPNGAQVVANAVPTKTTNDRWSYVLPTSGLAEGGPYTVTITVVDQANKSSSETFTYSIDKTAPTVSSIERLSPNASSTNSSSVSFKVTFSERVSGVDGADFTVVGANGQAIAGVTVSAVAAPGDTSGTIWNVSVSNIPGSFNGDLTLKLASAPSVADGALNAVPASTLSASYTLDQTGPSIASVTRSHAASTNADAIYFDLVFSEAIDASTIRAANFSTNAGVIASVTGSGTTWRVAVSGVNDYTGGVQLSLVSPTAIKDAVGNSLSNAAGQIGAAILLDNTAPTLSVAADRSATNAATASFVATFNEAMDETTVTSSQFTVNAGTIASVTRIGATNAWRVTVEGLDSFTGTLSLGLASPGGMRDVAGNLVAANTSLWGNTIVERTAPTATVTPVTTSATNADSITFDVAFSEAMDAATISADSFSVNLGTLSVAKLTGVNTWRVTVTGAAIQNYSGAIDLRLSNSANIKDVAGNALDRAANALLGTITLDNAAPVLSATLNNVAMSGVSGTTSQADFALAVTANETATLSLDTASSAKFSITKTGNVWTITRKTGVTLGVGSYPITVTAVDGLGNSGDTIYTIQLLAPSAVSVSSLSASDGTGQIASGGSTSLSSGRLNLTADYTTAKSVGVSIAKDGVTIANGAATKTNSSNGWTFDLGATALSDGATYTVTATATDFADVTSTPTTFTYTSDKTAPTASLSLSDRVLKSGETSLLTIASSEVIQSFDASKVTVTGGTLGAFVRSADGKSYSAVFVPSAGLARQTYSVSLAAGAVTDAADNVSAAAAEYQFVLDTKAPSLVSILRADTNTAARVSTNASVLEFLATFSEGVVNVDASDFAAYRNGAVLPATIKVTAQSASVYLVTVSDFVGDGDVDLRLAAGATINDPALVYDAEPETGNALVDFAAPSGARGYVIDRTGPTISAVTAGALSNGIRVITISFTEAIDADTFTLADLSYDTSLGALSNLIFAADKKSASMIYRVAENASGTQTISTASATFKDVIGNDNAVSSKSVSFEVDTFVAAPVLTGFQGRSIEGSAGLLSSNARPVFVGSGEAGASVTYKIWLAGSPEPSAFSAAAVNISGPGGWSVTPNALADGQYLAKFQIKDAAQNIAASVEYAFTIDTSAPVLPVIAPGVLSIAENSRGGTIASVAASDLTQVTYAITSASSPFAIDATGQITLSAGVDLDFETGPRSYDVTVQATDAAGNKTSRTYVISVGDVNEAPSAGGPLAFTTREDRLLEEVATGFSDPDQGDTLAYVVSRSAQNGIVQMTATGAFTYRPNANFNGADTFEVSVTDRGGLTAKKVVTITVDPVNDAPVVVATQTILGVEDKTAAGAVAATDVDGDPLSYRVSAQGAHGTAAIDPAGAFIYRPDANFFGEDSFLVEVTDGQIAVVQRVTVAVTNVGDAPTGGVIIKGTAQVGATLTAEATIQDADGLGALSYQWFSNHAPVAGARSSTYTVRGEDTGAALNVVVTYVDGGGSSEAVASELAFVPAVITPTAPVVTNVESKPVVSSIPATSVTLSIVEVASSKAVNPSLSVSSFTSTKQIEKSSTVLSAISNDGSSNAISSIIDAKPLAVVSGGRVSSTIVVPINSATAQTSNDATGSTPLISVESASRSAGGASLSLPTGIASRMQISAVDRGAVFEVRIATPSADSSMARVLGDNVQIVGGGDAVYKFGSSIFVKRGQGKVSFSLEVIEPSGERVIVPMTIDPTSGSIEVAPSPRGALGEGPLSFAELLRREADPQIDQLLASLAGAQILGAEIIL